MPLPPGAGPYPAGTSFGRGDDPALSVTCTVGLYVPNTSGYVTRGPYRARRARVSGDVQVPDPRGGGNFITIDERWFLPAQSNVRPRSIVTDVQTNSTYSVIITKNYGDEIECLVVRDNADA